MSRDVILRKVRGSLEASSNDKSRAVAVAERLKERPRALIPERAKAGGRARTELFASFLTAQSATVIELAGADEIPSAVIGFLRLANLPARVRTGADPYLAALPWHTEPALERCTGRAEPSDEVGLTHAAAAAAETGTMLMLSGPENPVTLNFLPETHIIVVEERTIAGCYEDAWQMIRSRLGDGAMPRTVNMVSGPSRTADIGGRVVTGAHGPRRVCVLIVKGG